MKTQSVRLLDVFVLGPFMVWYGVRARGVPHAARVAMVASGLLTMLYNGRNYLRIRAQGPHAQDGEAGE